MTGRGADRFTEQNGTYLLSHSIGLPILGSRESAAGYFDTWEQHTAGAWPRWLDSVDDFRAALAALLGTQSQAICPQSNVSSGLTKLLGSLHHQFDRPTVLISRDAFPSLGFVCERSDFSVRYLDDDVDISDPDAWRSHFDGVDIAVVTHVHSNTGVCLPITDIAAAARESEVITVVDVAQSAGIIPIDLATWGVDAVVGSSVKWLSGGPGAGWLWVGDALLHRCRPTDVGWFSHEQPFEFDIDDFRDAPDALRFWGGSPTVLPFIVAAHSVRTINEIGVDVIREHNLALIDALVAELGNRVISPHGRLRRSGTVIVRADTSAVDALADLGFGVDHRATGIRVSPHVHTSLDDIHLLVDALRTV